MSFSKHLFPFCSPHFLDFVDSILKILAITGRMLIVASCFAALFFRYKKLISTSSGLKLGKEKKGFVHIMFD